MNPRPRALAPKRVLTWMLIGVVILAFWQRIGDTMSGRLLVSQPTLMLAYARMHSADILHAAAITGYEAALGLTCAIVFSVGFGLASVYTPTLARLTYPWLLVSQVIPFVCLAPLIILVFGPGVSGKVVLSALMAFFPVAIGILTGMREIPRPAVELMHMMAASRAMIVRHVFIPYGLPHFFAGLRTAAPFCVIGAIVAEFNGAQWGIGKDLFIAAKRLEPELMMFGILTGATLSGLLYGAVVLSESQLGDWYRIKGEP